MKIKGTVPHYANALKRRGTDPRKGDNYEEAECFIDYE